MRGGPVVLPPEEARMLLTWPIPRRALVLPVLVAAATCPARSSAAAPMVPPAQPDSLPPLR